MPNLQFIYFDVGGVLIADFSGNNKWREMKRDLGFTDETIHLFDSLWEKHTTRVSLDYDIDNFVQVLNENANAHLSEDYSLLMDFVNRFEPNPHLAKLISLLGGSYQLGLLTNMYPRMLSRISEHNLLPQFAWNAVVDSSVVGYCKPDEAIYTLAEQKAQVDPGEILFIDNMEENLVVPQKRGWQTFLYDPTAPDQSAQELARKIGIEP